MQETACWKAAANLDLLLGSEHPPARIVRYPETALANTDYANVDARSTVSFRDTLYCNRQDSGYAGMRRRLAEYYRFMFAKIPLWDEPAIQQLVAKTEGTESSPVKKETASEELPASNDNVMQSTYRAVGILTQTNNPGAIGEELLLPWEFYPITDFSDEDAYLEPISALTKEVARPGGLLRVETEEEEEMAAAATALTAFNMNVNRRGGGGLSLYTRLVLQFTGIYPGMAVGIAGDPFKRSSSGVLTGVLVRQFILPARPKFPWGMERPLPLSSLSSAVPTRVHFCSGPFPRRDIRSILVSVTLNALSRGADLLIIGGPLVKEFEEFEKTLLTTMQLTFDELIGTYMDTIEETVDNYYTANSNLRIRHRLKVVLVAHRDDVTQIPAIPTTMYSVQDGRDVWVRSNPCRVSVNGIHFGVCNEDVVGDMRDRMIERWPTEAGSLRRVVEALVHSRLYAPIYELPAVKHELKHLHALRMDYLPEANTAVDVAADNNNRSKEREADTLTWNSVFSIATAGRETTDDVKRETKHFKQEVNDTPYLLQNVLDEETAVEWMPHVMFLPSTRPCFAVVTHRSVWDTTSGIRRDESELDDVASASGVMVVNQETWSRRSASKFELRVAEVTIPDSVLVMRRGASEANGVSCGIIHFTNSVANS